MTRRDVHFDAMLRHLGAAYYQTVLGDGSASAVTSALNAVDQEARRNREATEDGSARPRGREHRTGRWRVRDVMSTDVITVDKGASGTDIARLLTGHHISALPVLASGGAVAGVVSEADLLRAQGVQPAPAGRLLGRAHKRGPAGPHKAAQLMTAPATTIHPDAPIAAAARRMTQNDLTVLPVVDAAGELIGIVSRRDLLSVFLRPDADIAAEVRGVLRDVLLIEESAVSIEARDGTVTLAGHLQRRDVADAAVRLVSEIDGVLAVVDKLTVPPSAAGTAAAGTAAG